MSGSFEYRAGMEAATDLAQPIIEARERDMYDAMRERDEARAALAELVRLKDGPRDDAYRAAKDAAWDRARDVLAYNARQACDDAGCER